MIQSKLDDLSNRLAWIASQAGQSDLVNQLSLSPPLVQRDYLTIAVVGEFGRGKTTLINALLGQERLPMGGFPMDTSYWVVTQGEPVALTVQYTNGERATIEPTVEAISTLERSNELRIEHFELQTPMSLLPPGTRLLEAPGLGDVNPAHRKSLEFVLAQSSVVLAVVHAGATLSQAEWSFLQEVPKYAEEMLVVVNQIDLLAPSEQDAIVTFVREQVNKLPLRVKPQVFKLSALRALEYQRTGIADEAVGDWASFNRALQKLGQPQAQRGVNAVRLDQLRRAANDLASILKYEETSKATAPAGRDEKDTARAVRRKASLKQSRDLLIKVIDDQTDDIMQTVRDSFNARAFKLEQDVRAGNLHPAAVNRQLAQWVRGEEERVRSRLLKLYQSVVQELEDLTERTTNLQPVMQPVTVNAEDAAHAVGVSKPLRLLGALGGGVIVGVAARHLVAKGTALVFVSSGLVGGLTGVGIYALLNRASKTPTASLDLRDTRTLILSSFQESIQNNGARLKALVNECLETATDTMMADVADSPRLQPSAQKNLLAELQTIQRELESLDNL